MIRWAVFLSGQGSTAQSFFDLKSEIDLRLVVSNRRNAVGLRRAKRAGLPTFYFSKTMSWPELADELRRRRITAVFLLGFMKIVPRDFAEEFRIINVHPSILPAHPGLHAIEKSFADHNSPMGVTLHLVTVGVDEGPPFLQSLTLTPTSKENLTFEEARFLIAITEQRLVREGGIRFDRSLHAG